MNNLPYCYNAESQSNCKKRICAASKNTTPIERLSLKTLAVLMLSLMAMPGFGATVTGYVFSVEENTPIEYSIVAKQNSTEGTYTNEKGYFVLSNVKEGDTLAVSCVGYQRSLVVLTPANIAQPIRVTLKRNVVLLNEVKIAPEATPNYIYDLDNGYLLKNFFYPMYYGRQTAIYFKGFRTTGLYLKKISFHTYLVGSENKTLRIRVYSRNPATGLPMDDLIQKQLIAKKLGNKDKVTVKVEEKIRVPANGFFVVLESMSKDNDSIICEKWHGKPVTKGANVIVLTAGIPASQLVFTAKTCLYRDFDGSWKSMDNFPPPYIRLKFSKEW
jgi:hypothetical protein